MRHIWRQFNTWDGIRRGVRAVTEDESTLVKRTKLLRLAQALAEDARVSEVSPEDWKIVLKFLRVLLVVRRFNGTLELPNQSQNSSTDPDWSD